MYELYTDGNGYLILSADDPTNAIRVADMMDLVQLRKRVSQFIDTLEPDGAAANHPVARELTTISNAEARRLVQLKGCDLPSRTLLSACTAGNIKGAQKVGGRWTMPRWAFEEWLARWMTSKENQKMAP